MLGEPGGAVAAARIGGRMGIANIVAALRGGVGSVLRRSLATFSLLEACDGQVFVCKDGSLMTMVRVDGSRKLMGSEELAELVAQAEMRLSPAFRDVGHCLQFWLARDPDASGPLIRRLTREPRAVSAAMGLDLSDVFEERERHLPAHIVLERSYLCLWTRMSALSAQEMRRGGLDLPPPWWPKTVDTQYPFRLAANLRVRHDSFVGNLLDAIREMQVRAEPMACGDAIVAMRAAMYPDLDDTEWRPAVSGESLPGVRHPEFGPGDMSHLLWPRLDQQLFPKGARVLDGVLARVGDRVFGGIDMTVGPQTVTPFNDLLGRLRAMGEFPWRASLLVDGDGLRGTSLRSFLAAVCGPTNGDNRLLRESLKALQSHRLEGGAVVKFRCSFATWGPARDPALVSDRLSRLQRVVEGWGYCGAAPVAGDPLEGVMSSAVGLSPTSTAVPGCAPIGDAVAMMPWQRDASPFPDGNVAFRTVDGRLWEYKPGSRDQTTWIDLVYGPPGKGKSVWLNTTNLAFCLSPEATSGVGGARLPQLSIIDIGMSSSGLVSLLREALPPDRQHEVLFRKLRMAREDAINPFGVQIGLRAPMPHDKAFVRNFLVALCTEPGRDAPSGLPGLVSLVVDEAYERFSDRSPTGTPKPYQPDVEEEVDAAMGRLGMPAPGHASWFSVADALFARGAVREAAIAHAHAMPLLEDLPAVAASERVTDIYGEKTVDGEPIVRLFARVVSESLRLYPILGDVTRLDLGTARVVALDLQDAAPKGGESAQKQTALVYMLARYAMARDYYLNIDDIDAERTMPDMYRDWHRANVQRTRENPKRLVLDEFHRTSAARAVREQVTIDMREGRKWGVQIVLASQLLDDFDKDMLSLATGYWIMGCNNAQDKREAARLFGLSNSARAVLDALNGPSAAVGGAPFLAVLEMTDGRHEHHLVNTLGPVEIWAFSTSAADVALRNRLYESMGPSNARRALAARFPGGSANREIERRKNRLAQRSGGSVSEEQQRGVIASLAEEIARDWAAGPAAPRPAA